jgi:hypothetical protein
MIRIFGIIWVLMCGFVLVLGIAAGLQRPWANAGQSRHRRCLLPFQTRHNLAPSDGKDGMEA